MLHLLTHGRFDNMGSPLPYKLRVLYEKEAKNFQVINRMMFTKDHGDGRDRKSTRLNSSHQIISYAVFCLKKKKITHTNR